MKYGEEGGGKANEYYIFEELNFMCNMIIITILGFFLLFTILQEGNY